MIRFVALDLILRVILIRMVDVSFKIYILRVHFHNPAADVPRLGVPGHVIANFEWVRQGAISQSKVPLNEAAAAMRTQMSQRGGAQ